MVCPVLAASHFVCDDCLSQYTLVESQTELRLLRQRQCAVRCPGCVADKKDSPGVYIELLLARHVSVDAFSGLLASWRRVQQAVLAETQDHEVKRQVEVEMKALHERSHRQRAISQARCHIQEDILNLSCPRCRSVFFDFTGCFSVSCHACSCAFCAYCLQDCGNQQQGHQHAASCAADDAKVGLFGTPQDFARVHHARRERKLQLYFAAIQDAGFRREVLEACAVELVGFTLA